MGYAANLEKIIKGIYSSVILSEADQLSSEQIVNIVILALIFVGYFFKFVLVFFYFFIYRGIRKIGIFIFNFFRAKCCLNCSKICSESLKDFSRTMKKLFTYNFFLYSNFFYGFYLTIIFLFFVITHCVFSFEYQEMTPKWSIYYLLFSYESSLLFEVTCLTFFIILNPFFHVLISGGIFLAINVTIFIASLFQETSVIVVCFLVQSIYLVLIGFVLKTIFQFDYNKTMLKKLLREKNDYYIQKYNKANPLYLKEIENIDRISKTISLKGYYTNYKEPYFFFFRNRYYNKRRLLVFYIILFIEKILELCIDIYDFSQEKTHTWMKTTICFCHTILILYIAVSTFLKGEIQNKYIC